MAKFDDVQVDVTITPNNRQTTQIHSPAGQTPPHGAETPNVAPSVAAFSGGSLITPIKLTVSGVRIANPA